MDNMSERVHLPHQQRVIDEAQELNEKLVKLMDFINKSDIYKSLSIDDARLLNEQYYYMQNYFRVLNTRISQF